MQTQTAVCKSCACKFVGKLMLFKQRKPSVWLWFFVLECRYIENHCAQVTCKMNLLRMVFIGIQDLDVSGRCHLEWPESDGGSVLCWRLEPKWLRATSVGPSGISFGASMYKPLLGPCKALTRPLQGPYKAPYEDLTRPLQGPYTAPTRTLQSPYKALTT